METLHLVLVRRASSLVSRMAAAAAAAADSNKGRSFISGSASSLVACFVLQPFDVIKTRIQESPQRLSFPRAFVSIRQTEGLKHLWRGLGIVVLREGGSVCALI